MDKSFHVKKNLQKFIFSYFWRHYLARNHWILDRKQWIFMNLHGKSQLWQAVAPRPRGLSECRDMFLISESRDLAIRGHLIRWESRHAIEKIKTLRQFSAFSRPGAWTALSIVHTTFWDGNVSTRISCF